MAMEIINHSFINKRALMTATSRDDVVAMKELETGRIINVANYYLAQVTNEETGEVFNSIVVIDKDTDEAFGTRSETFQKRFTEIWDELADDGEEIRIAITRGKTKKGNQFTSCRLVS